jgi:hypothetical protein
MVSTDGAIKNEKRHDAETRGSKRDDERDRGAPSCLGIDDRCASGDSGSQASGDLADLVHDPFAIVRRADRRSRSLVLVTFDCALDATHALDDQRFELRQISGYFFVTSGKALEVGKKRGINDPGVDIRLQIHGLAGQQVTAFSGFGIDK